MDKVKTIFICTDGTWNTPSQTDQGVFSPTNVAKIARIIQSNDEQLVYYDNGVGTGGTINQFFGGAFGHGLFRNIKQAYEFLVNNYNPGDKVILLGFSRGAYTARSLAGMISKVGILRRKYISDLSTVYKAYRNNNVDKDWLNAYSSNFCHQSRDILMVGVWDTVGALGIPLRTMNFITRWRFKFHNTKLSTHIKHAYHAVAIDERRAQFKPALWDADNLETHQVMEQCWFAGVHSNVGGGYKDARLSDITLAWMLDRLNTAVSSENISLLLDQDYVNDNVNPSNYELGECGVLRDSVTAMYFDSKILPHVRKPPKSNTQHNMIDPSVKERMECQQCNYQPENLK